MTNATLNDRWEQFRHEALADLDLARRVLALGRDGMRRWAQHCRKRVRAGEPLDGLGWRALIDTRWELAKPTQATAKPTPPPRLDGPLPPGAVRWVALDSPCRRCGSMAGVEVPISGGRTRVDCRECGRFVAWGIWERAE